MDYVVGLWIAWVVLGLILLGLLLYRTHVTTQEDDELLLNGILDESGEAERLRQREAAARVNRIKPAIQFFGGVEGAVTLSLAASYVLEALRQF